jgi:hypothetical protein
MRAPSMQLGMLKMSGNFMSTEEGTIKKKENNIKEAENA